MSDISTEIYQAFEIRFPTELGKYYQVQTTNYVVDTGGWENIGAPIQGSGEHVSIVFGNLGNYHSGYFRVVEVAPPESRPPSRPSTKYVKYYDADGTGNWEPIGYLMDKHDGRYDAAIYVSKDDPNLAVWEVELTGKQEMKG